MRPYLAIVRDSFHEALASRVLWILLAIITLVLVALLPLGIVEQVGSILREEDLFNPPRLLARIVAENRSADPSPGRRIWELLDPPTKRVLESRSEGPGELRHRQVALVQALQTAITRRDFYRKADWPKATLPASALSLLAKGLDKLPDDQLARFNRLALEAGFPGEIVPIGPKQIQLAYFSWELGLPLPVEPEQLFPAINQIVVTTLGILLGVAGVFVAVLVTASMIPQAFEAGSVDLLLSKPIFRGGLFLAKFVGGCAFIAINAAYFIGGLWLVLGMRFGLWNSRLLWAIPLYLFLFAIYYGVSSLAGLVWRNAIVSVVLAVVFWFVCWALGTANGLVEAISLGPRRLLAVVPAGDSLIAVDQSEIFRWDDASGDWRPVMAASGDNQMPFMFRSRLVGPVYDPSGERILSYRTTFPGLSPLRTANRLLVGKQSDDWRRSEGVTVPEGAFGLFVAGRGEVLIVAPYGIYRLQGNAEARQEDINVFGLHVPLPQTGGRFVDVGPKMQLRPLESAAFDPQTGSIALFDGFQLVLFKRSEDGTYHQSHERQFERKNSGQVAMGRGQVFLALGDGEVERFDDQLQPLEPPLACDSGAIDTAIVSPDGRYLAVVSRARRLSLFDVRSSRAVPLDVAGQGDISAVAFDGGDLLVADRLTRVSRYGVTELKKMQQWQGQMPLVEKIYRYVLHPLYVVFPKPGQLNDTVNYVLTSKDSPSGAIRFDEGRSPVRMDVWGPIWSNLAFLVVVLALACAYVSRKDF
jgi:ABC-type transport system involved in multi-copper enzyme maturation permease subunit